MLLYHADLADGGQGGDDAILPLVSGGLVHHVDAAHLGHADGAVDHIIVGTVLGSGSGDFVFTDSRAGSVGVAGFGHLPRQSGITIVNVSQYHICNGNCKGDTFTKRFPFPLPRGILKSQRARYMSDFNRADYWFDGAEYDLQAAHAMLDTRRMLYVGFMCHQAI